MPFTFSHPGAVLPLGFLPKRYFSMTALVIGSIAPDFEYFFRMRAISYYSHRWSGMLWFDLPLIIILAFIFHSMVRDRLIENLPGFISKRVVRFKGFDWPGYFKKNYPIVLLSAIIGAASHLLWDRFTHESGIFDTDIQKLKDFYSFSFRHRFATYNLLQLISSIVGILIIFFTIFRLPAEKAFKRNSSILPYWVSILIVIGIVVSVRYITGFNFRHYRDSVMTIISGGLLGLLLTSLFFNARNRKVSHL